METSKNGIIDTYMCCMYVQLQPCIYISDVSKRSILGSADDDIVFFLYVVIFFYGSWVNTLFFIVFSLFWRCTSLFFIVFFQLYGIIKNYNVGLVEKHRFAKKYSNFNYLIPKFLLQNRGRHSVIFQYFENIFQYCLIIFFKFKDKFH